jgi:hypothetical protein
MKSAEKAFVKASIFGRYFRACVVRQFDCGGIVNWKTPGPGRILGACWSPVIDPVNAARFMTAASTW